MFQDTVHTCLLHEIPSVEQLHAWDLLMFQGQAMMASCWLTEVGQASAIAALHNKPSITVFTRHITL